MILFIVASTNNADIYFCVLLQHEYYVPRAAFKEDHPCYNTSSRASRFWAYGRVVSRGSNSWKTLTVGAVTVVCSWVSAVRLQRELLPVLKALASPSLPRVAEEMGADVRRLEFGSDKDLDQNIKQKYFRESFWEEVSYMGSMACQAF